ncbi:hypothetical protein SLA2020_006540 [Shorea laevis]
MDMIFVRWNSTAIVSLKRKCLEQLCSGYEMSLKRRCGNSKLRCLEITSYAFMCRYSSGDFMIASRIDLVKLLAHILYLFGFDISDDNARKRRSNNRNS